MLDWLKGCSRGMNSEVRNDLLRMSKVSYFFTLFIFFFLLDYIMLKIVDLDSIKTWEKTLNSEFLAFLRLNVNSEEYKKHTCRYMHP